MSTRFNSYGTTHGLATESTQRKIKDRLNGFLDVNVVSLPGGGSSTNIVSVASSALPDAFLPVSIDRTTTNLNTNTAQINGVTTSVNAGTSDTGTQRVVVASDQSVIPTNIKISGTDPSTNAGVSDATTQRVVVASDQSVIPTNIKISGTDPSTNAGTADATTQRVVIASDQSVVPVDVRFNNVAAAVSTGTTNLGTQRVTIASDLDPRNWKIQSIFQPRLNFLGRFHQSFSTSVTSTSVNWRFIQPSETGMDFMTPSAGILSTVFLPTANANIYISSTSANDTLLGTGARTLTMIYVNALREVQVVNINMNGTSSVLVASNFFRLLAISITSTGSLKCNQGIIQLTSSILPPINYYPGAFGQYRNQWESSHVYMKIQNGALYDESKFYSSTCLDYVNYLWHNSGGSDEQIGIFLPIDSVNDGGVVGGWRQLNTQYNNNDIFYSPDISNIIFGSSTDYDLVYAFNKTGAGTTSITVGVGWHNE